MKILVEEHQYEVEKVKDILYGIDAMENVEGKVSIHYVGYYYNSLLKDCVFILPKVLMKDVYEENDLTDISKKQEKVFGKYLPESILDLNKNNPLEPHERDFIYKFAVWIYRAIVVYKRSKNFVPEIVYHVKMAQMGSSSRRLSNTYLDILLQLIQFSRDNQNFIFFIVKNMHSGLNKINWTRTINRTSAIIQNENPIYLNPVNKKRQINFDEELLIIYFSILNYIGEKYGFDVNINCRYQLITGNRFETYLNGFGKTRLRQIKYKYFSDKALGLWNLCFAFFEEAKQVFVNTEKKEYLLVKNFYTVFEAIVDELVGDNPLPDEMEKEQEDGKIVDHLFTAKSLIEKQKSPTYYIGDSKYYKIGHELDGKSIYKQYTYARNVIQWNIDILNSGKEPDSGVKLRDDITEGYNIIPNFFISAKLDESLNYENDGIEQTDRINNKHVKTHFKNRLFDRDTLLLFHYDVNFLFVLSLYARDNALQKRVWKEEIRSKFRAEVQDWLKSDYDFYAMKARPGVDAKQYFATHFRNVLGKTFCPFLEEEVFSLALDNKDPDGDNDELITELRKYFYVENCELGKDPIAVIDKVVTEDQSFGIHPDKNGVLLVKTENFDRDFSKFKNTGNYAVGLYTDNKDSMTIVKNLESLGFVIFNVDNREYHLFSIKGKCDIKEYKELEDGIERNLVLMPYYVTLQIDSSQELDSATLFPITLEAAVHPIYMDVNDLKRK